MDQDTHSRAGLPPREQHVEERSAGHGGISAAALEMRLRSGGRQGHIPNMS